MTSLFTYLNPFNIYYGYGPTEDFKYFNGKYHLTGTDHQQNKHLIPINKIRCIYDDDIDNHIIKIITDNNEGYLFDGISNINRLLYDIQRYHNPSTLYLITNIFDKYTRKFIKKSSTTMNNNSMSDNTMLIMEEINESKSEDEFVESDNEFIENTINSMEDLEAIEKSNREYIEKEIMNPKLSNDTELHYDKPYIIETSMITNQYSLFGFVLNEPDNFVSDKDEIIHITYNNDNRYFTIDTSDSKYREISKFFLKK